MHNKTVVVFSFSTHVCNDESDDDANDAIQTTPPVPHGGRAHRTDNNDETCREIISFLFLEHARGIS